MYRLNPTKPKTLKQMGGLMLQSNKTTWYLSNTLCTSVSAFECICSSTWNSLFYHLCASKFYHFSRFDWYAFSSMTHFLITSIILWIFLRRVFAYYLGIYCYKLIAKLKWQQHLLSHSFYGSGIQEWFKWSCSREVGFTRFGRLTSTLDPAYGW